MADWVKFHGELRRGAKRGIPRALRFVFLELCHETRPGRGVIDLAPGMTDAAAVFDILGGNKREIVEALKVMTAGAEPMIVIADGADGGRYLEIPSWETWNASVSEPAGSSTVRSRRLRERRNGTATVDATAVAPVATVPATLGATEENPSLSGSPSGSLSGISDPLLLSEPSSARVAPAVPKRARAASKVPMPVDWAPNATADRIAGELGFDAARVRFEADKFRSRSASVGAVYVNWNAAFETWLRNAKTYELRDGRGGARGQPVQRAPELEGHDYAAERARWAEGTEQREADFEAKHGHRSNF